MTPKPWLPRRRRRSGTGDICLGLWAIRPGLDAGSIRAPLEPRTAAGPRLKTLTIDISRASGTSARGIGLEAGSIGTALKSGTAAGTRLKTLAKAISRASGTTIQVIGLEAGSIGATLESGTALGPRTETGPRLKTLIREISRASGTTTHAIALEAVTIRTRLGPGAAREPLPAHVAVITPSITPSLGSAIVGGLPRRGVGPGIVAAASDIGRGWGGVIGRGHHGYPGGAGITTVSPVSAAITAAAGSA